MINSFRLMAGRVLSHKLKGYAASRRLSMSEVFEDLIAFCAGQDYLSHPFYQESTLEAGVPIIRMSLNPQTMDLLMQEMARVGVERHFVLAAMANYYLDAKYEHAPTYDRNYGAGLIKESYYGYKARRSQESIAKKQRKAEERLAKDNAKRWLITRPNGELLEINNLKAYCDANGLRYQLMIAVSSSFQKQHRGYKCNRLR